MSFFSSVPPTYTYDMGIDTGGSGTATIDPAQLQAINDAIGERVLRAGDTMTGNLVLNADPTDALAATTKQYVDQIAGITFDDAGFQIYNTDDPTKLIKFSASNIDTNTTRTYILPDENGVLCLLSDLHTQFSDNQFAVYDDVDITKSVRFETSGITTATQRVLTIPDQNGTLALTSQLYTPPTTFADNSFAVYDDLVPSKVAQFDASAITAATTRTYSFPDVSGTLALTSNIGVYQAPLSAGASIDPTDLAANTISVIPQFGDTDFQIKSDLTPTAGVRFDASAVLANQVVTLQSTSGTLAYLSDIQPQTSPIAGDYINSVALTTTDTIAVTPQFDAIDFEVYDTTDNTKRVSFAVDNITTATTREMRFPDIDQTLVGETATQTLTNKQINMTGKTITNLTDAVLSHEPATKNQLDALASGITAQGSADLVDESLNSAWSYSNGTGGFGATLTRNVVDAVYSIDGVDLIAGTSVLFVSNFGSLRNGYYICNEPGSGLLPAQFTRDPRFDGTTPENVRGSLFSVLQGSTRSNTLWVQTSPDVVAVGIDAINYETFSNTSVLTSGINTTINANAIDVDITQNLDMHNNKITNLLAPTTATDAATKQYVDDLVISTPASPLEYYYAKSNSTVNQTLALNTALLFATPTIQASTGTAIAMTNNNTVTIPAGKIYKITAGIAFVNATPSETTLGLYRNGVLVTNVYTVGGTNYESLSTDLVYYDNGLVSAAYTVRPIATTTAGMLYWGLHMNIEEVSKIQSDAGGIYTQGSNIAIVGSVISTAPVVTFNLGDTYLRDDTSGFTLKLDTTLSGITSNQSIQFRSESGIVALLSDIGGPTLPVYDDNAFTLVDNFDNTKTAKFQLAQITPSTVRTYTLPDRSDTIATISDIISPITYTASGNITKTGANFDTSTILNFNLGDTYLRDDTSGFTLKLDTTLSGITSNQSIQFRSESGIVALMSDLPSAGTTYTAGNQITLTGDVVAVVDPFSVSNLRIKDGITNYVEISGTFSGVHSVVLPDKPGVVAYIDDLPAANVLGVYLEVGHEITADAGDSVVGVWTQRTLNTVYSITNTTATLVANQIVNLEAGTYDVQAISQFSKTGDACIRLYNVSGASQIMLGIFSPINPGAGAIANVCHLAGRFTLSVASTIELQYHATNNPSGTADRGDYSAGLPGGVPVVITKMIIQTANSSSVGFNAIAPGSFYGKNYTTPKTFTQNPGDFQSLNIWGDIVGINSDWVTYDAQNRLYILSGVYNYDVSIEVFCSTSDVAQAQNFTCALTGGTNKLAPALWGGGTEASGTTLANQIVKIKANFSNIQIAAGNYMGLAFRNNNLSDATNIKVYQVLLTIDRS